MSAAQGRSDSVESATQVDDATVVDALRANLGLTQDVDVNLARLQQAADFVAAVNAQHAPVVANGPWAGVRRA